MISEKEYHSDSEDSGVWAARRQRSSIGVLGGGPGGPWPPPGKNILLGRTELGSLAERKLTV